jgi:hypothetical protein
MFDYVSRKTDPKQIAFYCGCVPFAIPWTLHNSLWTGFLLEAYLISVTVFVFLPFDFEEQNTKQRWFWKAMLRFGAVVHPLFLGGLCLLDATYAAFVTGTGTIVFMAIVVGAIESVILSRIVSQHRPVES